MDIFLSTWVPVVQGIVTILALIGGTIIAWVGLSTWKRELVGKADQDRARRILLAAHKAKDAMREARPPRSLDVQLHKGGPEADAIADKQQVRWEKFHEAVSSYEAELVEAQAMWDEQTVETLYELSSAAATLDIAYALYTAYDGDEEEIKLSEFDKTLFRSGYSRDDEFDQELIRKLKRIEDVLRPKLLTKHTAKSSKGK